MMRILIYNRQLLTLGTDGHEIDKYTVLLQSGTYRRGDKGNIIKNNDLIVQLLFCWVKVLVEFFDA